MTARCSIAARSLSPAALGILFATAGLPALARAEDKATAQVLFETGRTLMEEGNYEQACPKLAESQRLDPGGGTLLNLALCHEREGKTATAWGEFKEALGVARADGREDRVKFATDHITALEPRLSHLVVNVAPEAKVAGLVVTVNGTAIGEPVWGIATPVDPGIQSISADAPGYEGWKATLELRSDGDRQAVTVPALRALPAAPSPAPSTSPAAGPASETAAPSGGASTQAIAGYVVGAVGLVGVVVGAIFGGRAISLESEAAERCSDDTCPDGESLGYSDDASTSATLADVFIGSGLALVAIGLIVVLTADDEPTEPAAGSATLAPWVGPSAAGVTARVAFP